MIKGLKAQLNHWFYKESDEYREGVKMEQLKKAAAKYPKPFDPKDWTPEQLVEHAMQENYDQQNYIYGLYMKIQEYEKNESAILENCELRRKIEQLEHDLVTQTENTKFWYNKANEYMKANLKQKHKG